jgi:predicted GIY-YIG superfamily endonuclease
MPGLDPGINSRHQSAVPYWVYLLANSKRGTLYVGVTNDLVRRVFQHRQRITRGFTSRYAVIRLVHYEQYDDPTRQSSGRETSSTGRATGRWR